MKRINRFFSLPVLAPLALVSLESCYFNSAGHIFDKASHQEAMVTADIKPGTHVYRYPNDTYYVELPRYRYDKPIITQYPDDDQGERKNRLTPIKGETVMAEIPKDYAMYLTGRASGPRTTPPLTTVRMTEEDKQSCSLLPVVRKPETEVFRYPYKSPNALGWYTLGVLDWLCVDLPVTCLENGLTVGVGAAYALSKIKSQSASASYGGGGGSMDAAIRAHQEYERQNMLNDAANRANGR